MCLIQRRWASIHEIQTAKLVLWDVHVQNSCGFGRQQSANLCLRAAGIGGHILRALFDKINSLWSTQTSESRVISMTGWEIYFVDNQCSCPHLSLVHGCTIQ